MTNISYASDCMGPNISSVMCKNPSYSGPSYPSSPVSRDRIMPESCLPALSITPIRLSLHFQHSTPWVFMSCLFSAGKMCCFSVVAAGPAGMRGGKEMFVPALSLIQTHSCHCSNIANTPFNKKPIPCFKKKW